jgi:hypothetical protein
MGFVRTGWCDPLAGERALQAAHLVELERLGRRQMAELAQLLSRHEQERALSVANYSLARERFWREWAGIEGPAPEQSTEREREQRREPS